MGNIKDSSIYLDKLYPKVEVKLKSGLYQLTKEIARFLDARNSKLSEQGPTERILFSDTERLKFCQLMGLSMTEIDNCIDLATGGNRFITIHKPFNIACVLAIRACRKMKKHKEEKLISYLLGISLYSGRHVKYFKFLPNKNIMAYTINHMSNKYMVKQLGTIGRTIEYTCVTNHEKYTQLIENCSDADVHNYIMNLNTRINGMLQNIATEFYKNHEQGNYMNTEEDNYTEENYYQTDNNSLVIDRISSNIALSMVAKGLDHTLAEAAAKQSGISVAALKNAIMEINTRRDNEIKELVTNILQVYLEGGTYTPRSIKSRNFIAVCHALYLKSNTSNESILKIKEILDVWLTECSDNYNKTERIATKNNFRKAVYMYYVLNITKCYND